MLNDVNMCFNTEMQINTDHDLQLIEVYITGVGYKIINKHRENQSGGSVACIYKRHLNIQTCTEEDIYTSI